MTKRKNWKKFPFDVDGINFISRVDMNSSTGKRIAKLPEGIFEQMNIGAIRDILGNVADLSIEELSAKLEVINDGGSYAFIELG